MFEHMHKHVNLCSINTPLIYFVVMNLIICQAMFLETSCFNLITNIKFKDLYFIDDEKCESCEEILEELETIDDDTDKHGIQFVKSKDSKLASAIGIFSFPALVYYETGVPIMYDGESFLFCKLS